MSAPAVIGRLRGQSGNSRAIISPRRLAFAPQPDIGPKGRSDQDMAEPAGSTHLLVCIGHGQGTLRVTDPVKKIVTSPAPAPAFR